LQKFRKFDEKKFGWDGEEYESKTIAEQKARECRQNGFDIRVIEENGKFYVFTRREARVTVSDSSSN